MSRVDETIVADYPLPDPVFEFFSNRPGLEELLRRNPYLPEQVWLKLYTKKLSAPTASAMVDRHLTDAQIDHVIAIERRSSTLALLVNHHPASRTTERLEKMAAVCKSSDPVLYRGVEPNWPSRAARTVEGAIQACLLLLQRRPRRRNRL